MKKSPRPGAFFDLDRTILAGFTGMALARELARTRRIGADDLGRIARSLVELRTGGAGMSGVLAAFAKSLRGMRESEFQEMGEKIFAKRTGVQIYAESRALVRDHQRRGHLVAIVSSALPPQVIPVARDLGVEVIACTRLEVKAGRLTGAVVRPTVWGTGKALAVTRLAREHALDLEQSFYYGDSYGDRHVMEIVGNPRPTNPEPRLAAHAKKRGWKTQKFRSRGLPGAGDVARTLLAVGSVGPAVLSALPAALQSILRGGKGIGDAKHPGAGLRERTLRAASRRLRPATNQAVRTWGELGIALGGVTLDVAGEENLQKRPAVFIFNHQSALDMLIICRLLQGDFVGIAKRELASYPLFGSLAMLAGTVFVDRLDHQKAVAAMSPVADALRGGLSVAIAPEGTRSPTPRLGRFKKGAFHLAMEARVPIIPIVIENASDALPKRGLVIRRATVAVTILPPIPTTRWKRRNLDAHVARIHGLFQRTLDSGPVGAVDRRR